MRPSSPHLLVVNKSAIKSSIVAPSTRRVLRLPSPLTVTVTISIPSDSLPPFKFPPSSLQATMPFIASYTTTIPKLLFRVNRTGPLVRLRAHPADHDTNPTRPPGLFDLFTHDGMVRAKALERGSYMGTYVVRY